MREALFVKQNSERWNEYEPVQTDDPDELAKRFITITDDLAYAKTFYPQSRVTVYLNKLASGIYLGIYKNKKEESSRIISFWKTELPLVIRKHHRILLYSFIFFLIFSLMAAFSAANDQQYGACWEMLTWK